MTYAPSATTYAAPAPQVSYAPAPQQASYAPPMQFAQPGTFTTPQMGFGAIGAVPQPFMQQPQAVGGLGLQMPRLY
jgi:hypothetical protein